MESVIKTCIIIIFLLIPVKETKAGLQMNVDSSILDRYNNAFNRVKYLLQTNGSFQSAVFAVEHSFCNDSLSEDNYSNTIDLLADVVKKIAVPKKQFTYGNEDNNFSLNFSIFSLIRDQVYIISDSTLLEHSPFRYDDNDPNGKVDWSNMFVRKLLITHKGNCHSLTYLYKILADKLGAKCWMALAPNHIYIRNYSYQAGWYNSELTSGVFPTDAWIATTGYVSADAIRNGIYMDTLSNQQDIALCLLDLAKGYAFQTGHYDDDFIIKCCNLVLQYHVTNPQALLLKAETFKKLYLQQVKFKIPQASATYMEMENVYITLIKLGYREMPEKMYQQWLNSLAKHKMQFADNKIDKLIPAKGNEK